MFNSPSTRPTPRKSQRPRETLAFPRATPSITSDHPITPSLRSSRLGYSRHAPAPPSPTSSAGETIRTVTGRAGDVEGYERVWWARDERMGIWNAGSLPREVLAYLKKADLSAGSVRGFVDQTSGYAFVSTPTRAVAWNYQKRTQASPTCYIFPAPPSIRYFIPTSSSASGPVLAALYTANPSEPGIVLVSADGEVRLWESMSIALSNVDRFHSVQIAVAEGDEVEHIWSIEPTTFIITTRASLAFRLAISAHGGRIAPIVTALTRPGGIWAGGRATNMLFTREEDKQGIKAVRGDASGVVLMSGRTLQKWTTSSDALRLNQEIDLYELIGGALFDEDWGQGGQSLQLDDLAVYGRDDYASLISYTEDISEGSSGPSKPHTSYAVILFAIHPKSNQAMVTRIIPVSHTPSRDSIAQSAPSLLIPHGSGSAFITFAHNVVAVSLSEDDEFEDVITLKDNARNAFIGTGSKTRPISRINSNSTAVTLMSATGRLLAIELFDFSGRVSSSDTAAGTAKLKSKLEQAVCFGDRSDNPLSFDLAPGYQGDVAEAAVLVSAEIASSSSPYLPAVFELKPQLTDRLSRLRELMKYVKRNGLLNKLPQSTRRQLSADAEKVRAAIDLWDHQNRLMDQMHSRSPQSLLADSIIAYMNQVELTGNDDVVRAFFRHHVQHVDRLLGIVFDRLRQTLSGGAGRIDTAPWIVEANSILLTAQRASSQYIEDEQNTYEIDRLHPAHELWTAQDHLLEAIEYLYTATQNLIRDRTRDLGSVIDESPQNTRDVRMREEQIRQGLLKDQMSTLAAAICVNMEDKIRVQATRQMDGGADPEKGLILGQRWAELKPKVIRPLVGIDQVARAYELAEHHRDFPTLVFLCHDPVAGSGQAWVQKYIEIFGEEFAFVLYQWYIDQGQLHALLSQDEVYAHLLTKFFNEQGYPELAWMHHLACKRYGEAAGSLVQVGQVTGQLSQKHLTGSIAKLSAVAEIKSRGDSISRKRLLIEIDDELDQIAVQNQLRETTVARNTATLSNGLDGVSNLTSRPIFKQLRQELLDRLVAGDALDLEGLVDVLTLGGGEAGDPAIALDRLRRDTSLPNGRKQVALISIWRRIFIRDDWSVIAHTSGRSEEAQREVQRATLTYSTLKAINELDNFPPSYILTPYNSIIPPTMVELTARFPEWSASDVQALMADHEDEIRVLEGYLQDGVDLEKRVREVAELVRKDFEADINVEDVLM